MTDEPIDIGVLGYRFMGKAHANALDRLPMFFEDAPETNRHTVIGRDEAALAEAANTLGFERTATDWREVIDEVDAFYNLGPNHLHVEPSIAALKTGTPVLCEKPLAPTLAGAEEMREAAAEADVPAACAFNYRFVPAIRYAKRLIDAGELGEIRQVRGRYLQDWLSDPDAPWSWRNDEDMAGSGALGDLGAHTIDLARFLVGDRVGEAASVSGHLKTFTDERPVEGEDGETRPVTVDDAYSAQVEYDSGAMATFEASRVTEGHKNDHTIAVHGSAGSLRFSLERLNELEVMTGDARGYETVLVTDEDDPYIDHWWPPGHVIGWEHTFVHENYEFLKSVARSTTDGGDEVAGAAEGNDFTPNFEDAYEVQRVLDAIERSDAEGVRVDLD
ncbi:Gfo/Idh/MocA family oxidoreductase [Halobaculum sp. CBA1158]|uniref:Gfo/Idh/MocA family protein n=1 Tax=Halobaculum sp. CBA1158 TaxID=2904243 RepID=UPI001F299E30|nr:Gfo/Idh/MocA family oxidoreductase [Halobaculum sp. CBA1158]UIO98653.1 Gfo/Idh/MocA family oxidoreductase [Halobaculum sp. CBA1158]